MAEAFGKVHGYGLYESCSAGSKPSGKVNKDAIAYLQEKAIDISKAESKSIKESGIDVFDYAIGMGCGDICPIAPTKEFINWNIPDPTGTPPEFFRKVRDEIEQSVIEFTKSKFGGLDD
jgi:protein-tyrosine-phosphatase